jgi:hypothetical protein
VPEREFTDAEIDRALEALTQPGRFREAESRVLRAAPQIQRVLNHALQAGGFFDEQHESQVLQAATMPDDEERLRAVRSLITEETRMGMLIGVAVGWELARELEQGD